MKNLIPGILLAMFFAAPAIAGNFAADTAPVMLADAHSVEQDENGGIGDERSEEAKQFGDREHGNKKGHEKREDRDNKEKNKKKKNKKDKKGKKKKDKQGESGDDDDEDDDDDDEDDEESDEENDDDDEEDKKD